METPSLHAAQQTVLEALVDLHRHLDDSATLGETLQQVAVRAHGALPSCDTAAITVYVDGEYRTAAMAGTPAQSLDDAQYESDTGPCLDAHRTGQVVEVPDLERAGRWPEFRAAALEHGFASSMSLPLVVGPSRHGALNLYSTRLGPLEEPMAQLAETFARKASVAVANVVTFSKLRDTVDQLSQALDARDQIGQAKGILMARHKITADEAFQMLVDTSNRANIKVREIVKDVIATGELGAYPPT
jgi:GAF domain-containing protein